jgi:hypothetical protein
MKTNYDARRSVGRAPANGAPGRTLRSATCGGERARSGSTPIGDRAPSPVYEGPHVNRKTVTPPRRSVTHVLNLKCYLCIDRTVQKQIQNRKL